MCGRYILDNPSEIFHRFEIEDQAIELKPNYNVAPTHNMPVIVQNEQGHNQIQLMRWGLIPHWAKESKIGFKMINARSETVDQKPTFKGLLKRHRCLVPATGFYEWDRVGGTKTPYLFHLKTHPIYAFAGLYDVWQDPKGEQVKTYTILTTQANATMQDIHDRMPVILKKQYEDEWLNNRIELGESISLILKPYADSELTYYEVSPDVNSVKNNSEKLIDKL